MGHNESRIARTSLSALLKTFVKCSDVSHGLEESCARNLHCATTCPLDRGSRCHQGDIYIVCGVRTGAEVGDFWGVCTVWHVACGACDAPDIASSDAGKRL